jgi:hypothetical protein
MIAPDTLTKRFSAFLGSESRAASDGRRITLLTPAEYPDCDGITVQVEEDAVGGYVVSDMATADSLLIGHVSAATAAKRAEQIARRFDAEFVGGAVLARTGEEELPEACWRVAQASAAIAEALLPQGRAGVRRVRRPSGGQRVPVGGGS